MQTSPFRTGKLLFSLPVIGGLLAASALSAQLPTPILHYGLNEASGNYGSTGSASVDLFPSGDNQRHGDPGSGVSGLPHDRAWDASANTAQGATPAATNNSRLSHAADFDDIDALPAFTFTFWYNLEQYLDSGTRFLSNAPSDASAGFLLRSVTTGTPSRTALELRLGNGAAQVFLSNQFAADTGYRRINTWVFVGITWDGTAVRFFVADKETGVEAAGTHTFIGGPLIISQDNAPLIFGNRSSNNGVDGFLDNLRIYDVALDLTQLETIRQEDLNPPVIVTGAVNGPSVVDEGQPIVLVADTSGTSPVVFRWYRDDVLLPDQTSATLEIAAAGVGDAGTYRYEADDANGTLVSAASHIVQVIPGRELLLAYGFNEPAGNYGSIGMVKADLLPGGDFQQAGAPGSGVSGQPWDRAWDATANTIQSHDDSGPVNNARLEHVADIDEIDNLPAFSISMWYWADQPMRSAANRLLYNANSNTPSTGMVLRWSVSSGNGGWELFPAAGSTSYPSTRYPAGQGYNRTQEWIYLGIAWDGTTLRYYMGDKETPVTEAGAIAMSNILGNDPSRLVLGNTTSYNRGFDGKLDNFRLFGGAPLDLDGFEALRQADLSPPANIIIGERSLMSGDRLELTADTSGSNPVAIAWFRDDIQLLGQNSATLVIDPVSVDDAGVYRYEAYDAAMNIVSQAAATVTVKQAIGPLTLLLDYNFNEPSGPYSSNGAVAAELIPYGLNQQAGEPGSGVSGLPWDRAWDATANTIQSHDDAGSLNDSRLEHYADIDAIDNLPAFAISVWYWADQPMRSAGNRLFYNANATTNPTQGFFLRWITTSGNSGWEIFAGPGGGSFPSTKYPVGQGYNRTQEWIFLGIAWDGSTLRYYVGDKDTPVAEAGEVPFANIIGNDPSKFVLGNIASANRGFDGKLDNFRFYSGAPIDLAGFEALRQADLAPIANTVDGTANVTAGGTVVLMANVAGLTPAPASYRWYYNDTLIDGATGAIYEINSASLTASGLYSFEALDGSGNVVGRGRLRVGVTPSSPVGLTPQLVRESAGNVLVFLPYVTGATGWQLQATDDLGLVWSDVATSVDGVTWTVTESGVSAYGDPITRVVTVTDARPDPAAGRRFWRLVAEVPAILP